MRREERVMRICSRAVAIDPRYADAWALLAIAQSSLHYGFGSTVDDGFAAAHAALSINPSIAEAHCPRARRLEERGRPAEAWAEIETALRLNPDSWEVNKEAARFHMRRREIPQATGCYEKAVELMESDFHSWALLASCYLAQGDEANVRRAARMMVSEAGKALAQDPSNGAALGIMAGGHALLGEREKAEEWIERAMLIDPDNMIMRYNFACVLATRLNDPKGALNLLERVLAVGPPAQVRLVQTDPDLDPLRDHPRFQQMLARAKTRVGIAEPEVETGSSPSASPAAS
jgi:adenylate cyclase